MAVVIDGTTGITTPGEAISGNLSYTGTLTGGTGVVNLGSGQVYKDASGNVGIGTSSMTRFFNLYDTTTNAQTAYFKSTQASGGAGFVAYNNGGEAATFQINGSSNTSYAGANSVNIGSITNNNLAFITNNTERARIDTSGNLMVGATTSSGIGARNFELNSGSAGGAYIIVTGSSNTVRGELAVDGAAMYIGAKTNHPVNFRTNDAIRMTIAAGGAVSVSGALSKGSGSFRIDHPLPALSKTHQLVHSFIEGPQADNIYRGKVTLVGGAATVNIDASSGMTEGTFVALNREVQCFTTNETGWVHVRGKVTGNLLTIEAQDATCTDTISWMVIGERQDKHMYETEWTDKDGKVIVEPLKDQTDIGTLA